MIVNRHLGALNKNDIIRTFNRYDFKLIHYIYINNGLAFVLSKDYAKKFNIDFNGLVTLEVRIDFRMYTMFCSKYYPKFFEISDIIPKTIENHIYSDGSICYAPPQRPIDEKWKIENFIVAVDAMINNYFSVEYIGKRTLIELEHGKKGLEQYISLKRNV